MITSDSYLLSCKAFFKELLTTFLINNFILYFLALTTQRNIFVKPVDVSETAKRNNMKIVVKEKESKNRSK